MKASLYTTGAVTRTEARDKLSDASRERFAGSKSCAGWRRGAGIAGGAGSSALPPELVPGQVITSSLPHHHSQACSFSVTLKNPIFVGKIVLRFFFFIKCIISVK